MEKTAEIYTNLTEIQNKDPLVVTVNLVDTTPQTAANYGMFFTAHRPYEVVVVSEVHGTAGTDAGNVTLQVEKLTGTTAKGSGTTLLATAFNLKSTINTVVTKKTSDFNGLSSGSYPTYLAVGDRLALKSSGTLTAVKDVQVTVSLKPQGKGHYTL